MRCEGILGDHDIPLRPATEIGPAVAAADLIAIPAPASVQGRYLDLILPHLSSGQALWLCQGSGGSLLPQARARRDVLFIETMYLPFSARRTGPASVVIRARLRVPYAAFPGCRADDARRVLGSLFDLPSARNVLEVALQNVNAVLHPLPCLLNWGQIEGRAEQFVLTRDGMTPAVLRALEAVDRERVAVCVAAGLSARSVDEIYELLGVVPPPYRRRPSAEGGEVYEDRYVTEAVPNGLVTIASLGDALGVATALIDSTIRICDQIYETDSWLTGRSMARLGLQGLDAEGLRRVLHDG